MFTRTGRQGRGHAPYCERMLLAALLVAASGAGAALPAGAADPCAVARLAVGNTGILCYREPCPWRGIRPLSNDGEHRPARVYWAAEELPPLLAAPEDQARLVAAWDEMECLVVEGAFDRRTLAVTSIVGTCREVFLDEAQR